MAEPPAELLNKILWKIPNVLCLVGSRAGDEWNGMTTSWVTQVAMEPVLVAVSVDASAVTNRLIRDGGSFTVNLWDREDTRPFVKFSKPATREGDTLNGRPFRESVTGAPIFTEAAAWLDCRVWRTVDLGTHDLFIGEVVDAGFGPVDEEAPVARMEDTRMKYGGVKRGGHN
ncbi:MAG TPA: flavin reductase family protein [Acidimicrobiia bacterium]|jgi:flavin reductase (DIM6/NTAB) family NADH-FMN oxidoreductase RutF